MYINCLTWILFIHDFICYTKKWGKQELSSFSQRNGTLPFPRRKQGNYPVIPIYGGMGIQLGGPHQDF